MARITLRQLLDHAAEHGYGVPAFNINNMEQVLAIMEAARSRRRAGDPAGEPRRALLRQRHHARQDGGGGRAALPEHPDLPAPGPRQRRGHLPDRDPARLHLGDDGRLAPGRREDAGRLRQQRRRSRGGSPRSPTRSARPSRASSGVLGLAGDGQGEQRTGTARRAARARPAPDRPRPGGRLRRATRVDALAIAMGTSHGAYKFSRKPDGAILAMRGDRGDPPRACPTRIS